MEEENQEVENSPHGSVTGEGPSGGANIIGQQLTPSPPPRPQAVGRVRMAERGEVERERVRGYGEREGILPQIPFFSSLEKWLPFYLLYMTHSTSVLFFFL